MNHVQPLPAAPEVRSVLDSREPGVTTRCKVCRLPAAAREAVLAQTERCRTGHHRELGQPWLSPTRYSPVRFVCRFSLNAETSQKPSTLICFSLVEPYLDIPRLKMGRAEKSRD